MNAAKQHIMFLQSKIFSSKTLVKPIMQTVFGVLLIVLLIVVALQIPRLYNRNYIPIILSVTPNEVSASSENVFVILEGLFLDENTVIYANNMRLSNVHAVEHEQQEVILIFQLPPIVFSSDEVSIIAVNNSESLISARSNRVYINVLGDD